METVDINNVEKLIKYCPHCGSKADKEFVGLLSNGGAWTCEDCEEEVEAYVLSR
ncbi:hypothetical protein GGGNBK_21530 [Sporosarcina sp. ANT_H38]|uniref:hypothetical protein n=1 Tax=Sporosarcina sp. ANT_H38 TaxID=2597358 RepID=UPI00165D9587|nr:hypothetical protein [Sporosarcina sp. ANT_H38]